MEFPLPSFADSGNNWSAECLSGHGVASISVELGDASHLSLAPGDGIAEPPSIVLVPERAVICGLSCGEATWQMVLARSFSSSTPTATYNLLVTVVARS